jgi:hypothetical protein
VASEWIIRSGIELYKEARNDEPGMKAAGPLYKGQLGLVQNAGYFGSHDFPKLRMK